MTDNQSQDPNPLSPNSEPGQMGNPAGVPIPPIPPIPPAPNAGQYYPNQGYAPEKPNEKNAVMAMVFGIIGLAACGLVAPVGWVMGSKSRKAIKESNGTLGGEGMATAGMICGIIGTVFLALGFLYFIFWIIFLGGIALSSP